MLYVYILALIFLFASTSNRVFSQIGTVSPIPIGINPCFAGYVPGWTFGVYKIYINGHNCPVKVGIGTDNPQANLQVKGTTMLDRLDVGRSVDAQMEGMICGAKETTVPSTSSYPLINLGIYNLATHGKSSIFIVEPNGNLILSNGVEKIFEINAADKTAYSHEIILQNQQFWPDYVFKKEYNLMALGQLRKFIETNQHLPNIPKAADVYKNGLSLGEMNKRLLEKVEELTLYILKQQDDIEALKASVQELEKQIRKSK